MRLWPRLVSSHRPASNRVYACTIYTPLHYTSRCGIAVHVSMFSSALVRPDDVIDRLRARRELIYTNCTSTLPQHSPLQLQDCSTRLFANRLLLSLFCGLLNVTTSNMYICIHVLIFIIISTITSFLHVFDVRLRYYMYACFETHYISKMFTFLC